MKLQWQWHDCQTYPSYRVASISLPKNQPPPKNVSVFWKAFLVCIMLFPFPALWRMKAVERWKHWYFIRARLVVQCMLQSCGRPESPPRHRSGSQCCSGVIRPIPSTRTFTADLSGAAGTIKRTVYRVCMCVYMSRVTSECNSARRGESFSQS